jgi:hypothetical protein
MTDSTAVEWIVIKMRYTVIAARYTAALSMIVTSACLVEEPALPPAVETPRRTFCSQSIL